MMTMLEKKGGSNIDQTSATEVVVLGIPSSSKSIRVRSIEAASRAVATGLCVAAIFTMIKNSQTNDFGSISYDDLGALKYLVYANAVCSAYSVVSGFVTAVPRPNASISVPWILFCSDQVVTYMILGAGAASAEVLYLANNGDVEVTWAQACGVFGRFCHGATVSVGLTFGSVASYVGLSLISSYRLFSAYDTGINLAAFPG